MTILCCFFLESRQLCLCRSVPVSHAVILLSKSMSISHDCELCLTWRWIWKQGLGPPQRKCHKLKSQEVIKPTRERTLQNTQGGVEKQREENQILLLAGRLIVSQVTAFCISIQKVLALSLHIHWGNFREKRSIPQ